MNEYEASVAKQSSIKTDPHKKGQLIFVRQRILFVSMETHSWFFKKGTILVRDVDNRGKLCMAGSKGVYAKSPVANLKLL